MYRWVGGVGSARERAAGQDRCAGVRRRRRQAQVRRTVCGAEAVGRVAWSKSDCVPVLDTLNGEWDRIGSGLSSGERIRRTIIGECLSWEKDSLPLRSPKVSRRGAKREPSWHPSARPWHDAWVMGKAHKAKRVQSHSL